MLWIHYGRGKPSELVKGPNTRAAAELPHSTLALRCQVGELEQFAEARVGADGVVDGVGFQESHPVGTLFETLFEPMDGGFVFAEAEIDASDHGGGYVTARVVVY